MVRRAWVASPLLFIVHNFGVVSVSYVLQLMHEAFAVAHVLGSLPMLYGQGLAVRVFV